MTKGRFVTGQYWPGKEKLREAMRGKRKFFPHIIWLMAVISALAAFSAAAAEPLAKRTGFFFDTVITISLYDTNDESLLDECFERMEYYESVFSRTKEGSDIWNINHAQGKPVQVSEETADLITTALYYCEVSGGAFDITIAPVTDLWDFHEEEQPSLPDEEAVAQALSHVDYTKVIVDGQTVTLADPQAGIDLGAVAKGYISDGAAEILRAHGCQSALIDLGGNIYAVGSKPDGMPFNIGVRRPFAESAMDLAAVVKAADSAVITSGTYERYFELDGVLYHHILDTKTGYSVRNSLTSVSIHSPQGVDGDALSTTCFVMGLEEGMKLIESLDGIEAMFVDEDENICCSSGWE